MGVHTHTKCLQLKGESLCELPTYLGPEESMRELTKAELHQVAGGAIVKENGGGNTPNGEANGVPSRNPAGHEPPGHNK